MAQEVIYTKTRSHWSEDANWNPASSGHGIDSHVFAVPDGRPFARYSIDVEVASLASGYVVESAPKTGATGEQQIKIRWWFTPFGKIRYTLSAYAGEPEMVTIWHGENNWVGKSIATLRQEQNLTISGRGSVARRLFGRMNRITGNPMSYNFYSKPQAGQVEVTLQMALHFISTIKYGSIGGIIIMAMKEGYEVSANFDPCGPLPFDDLLTITLTRA
jgi:hypothetical protein